MKLTTILFLVFLSINVYSQQSFPFKKIRIQMPERTNTEHQLRDDRYFKFLPQYIGLKPNDLFEFDVSQLKLEKDTIYTCYIHFVIQQVFDKKVTHRSYRRVGRTIEFTTENVVDGILQLPYDFCKEDGFVITYKDFFIDLLITDKYELYNVFSRIALEPELE